MAKNNETEAIAKILMEHMENFYKATEIMGDMAKGCAALADRVETLEKRVDDLERKQKDGNKFTEVS